MRALIPMLCLFAAAASGENLHFTYLWHMEQPIYWPDQQLPAPDRYERAWQSIQRTDGGAPHPADNLREILSKDDRVAAYQWRVRDCVNLIRYAPEAGLTRQKEIPFTWGRGEVREVM